MILEIFPLGPAETNTFLIGCSKTKKAVVIDPAQGSYSAVHAHVKKKNLVLEKVLLTHSHWDHIVDVAEFKMHDVLSVYIHAEDAGNLQNPGTDGLPLFFPIAGVIPDVYLEEGDEILVGELKVRVMHTPGHSPGSVCFYLPEEKTILTGDTLFEGAIGNLSFPTSQPELMPASLKRLSELPKETKVYPGHGDPTTIDKEKVTLECLNV